MRKIKIFIHEPVLIFEILEFLNLQENDFVLDGTIGLGGHAIKILERIPNGKLFGFDLDYEAIKITRNNLLKFKNFELINENFSESINFLKEKNVKVDKILLDLGVSSMQLDDENHGFSLRKNTDLDFRMNKNFGLSASEKIRNSSVETLQKILNNFGEISERFRFSDLQKLAKIIFENRFSLKKTFDLVELIDENFKFLNSQKLFLLKTLVFQAIRIWVNDELSSIEKFLNSVDEILNPNGRIAIISFHSLEDRIVKNFFRILQSEKEYKILTKKPILPNEVELQKNFRSRSAKLRVIQKIL
ncbi:MAG: 16S rRNA (cytosine(1402)-N(4))-methyltransferase RsmH [Patescibacteria group bacterium]